MIAGSLAALFDSGRSDLLAEIGVDSSAARVVALLRHHLDDLPEAYARASGWRPGGPEARQLRLLITAVGDACTGSLLDVSAEAEEVVVQPNRITSIANRVPGTRRLTWTEAPAAAAKLVVDAGRTVARVQQALVHLDTYLNGQAELLRERPARPWRADPELALLIQDLVGGRTDPDDLTARVERLLRDLRLRHGIRAVDFDPADLSHDVAMFDLPAGMPRHRTGAVTVRPALLVVLDDAGRPANPQVLLRGEVALGSDAVEEEPRS